MAEMNGIETSASAWTAPRGRRWSAADGSGVAEAFRASGQSVAIFAASHGLHVERVRRWVVRVEGRRPKAKAVPRMKFAPIHLVQPQVEATLEIAVGAGVVRVRRGFDEALLRQVVAALTGDAC